MDDTPRFWADDTKLSAEVGSVVLQSGVDDGDLGVVSGYHGARLGQSGGGGDHIEVGVTVDDGGQVVADVFVSVGDDDTNGDAKSLIASAVCGAAG